MNRLQGALIAGSSDLQSALRGDPTGFGFRSELSLRPLAEFWASGFGEECSARGLLNRLVNEEVTGIDELSGAITDIGVLDRHQEAVDLLMAAVFSPAFFDQDYAAAMIPFQLRAFYATPPFQRTLMGTDGTVTGRVNLDPLTVVNVRRLMAYALVLRRIYGVELDVDYPLIFSTADPDTGLDRHFKMQFEWRFLEVQPLGEPPELPKALRQDLEAGRIDFDALREALPPERFLMRGFTVLRAVDVTDQEVVSALKRDLIDRESIVSSARFRDLQDRLRTLLRRPELRLGLAAIEGDQVLVLNYGAEMEHSCIFADSAHHSTAEFAGTIYAKAVKDERPVLIDDLAEYPRTPIEDDMLKGGGLRSVVVAPLLYQDRVIGTLELGSPKPADLTSAHVARLGEVLPLFSMAVQRSMEELDNRIQAVIKERCTAIHPVVEWRFRKAVLHSIERTSGGELGSPGEMEPIVFPAVHPLYALSDIRGSSTQRMLAIQTDLLSQLRLARHALKAGHRANPLPLLDELVYRVDRHVAQIERGVSSGDEVSVVSFLRGEIEPAFEQVAGFGAAAREHVEAYRAAIDPKLGAVYAQRRLFEESVTRITEAVSSYLDLEEQAAQGMFPHYFEKQKTDGVDYQIYVGASLLEDGGRYDPLYLRNLRLWQLMVTCGAALRAHQLRDRLAVPLEMTHLVLVQHAPLSIRFRFDEKRFDVDGAYDMRYEIVKKRIDKAIVKGTGERVTQPGTVAIVYAHTAEGAEYRRYCEYLQSLGYFTSEVEDVDLDEMQGVHGLRALRVTVDLANPRVDRPGAAAEVVRS